MEHRQSWKLTSASSRVENGNANSIAPGTRSSLVSAPKARTSLAVQGQIRMSKEKQLRSVLKKKSIASRNHNNLTSYRLVKKLNELFSRIPFHASH